MHATRWRGRLWPLATLLWAYLVILLAATALQRSLLFLPDPRRPDIARAGMAGMAEQRITTADGLALGAWFLPPREETAPVVVFLHGNAGHWGHRVPRARAFAEAGFGVLLMGYRGYGGNPGSPSEDGLIEDGRAALDFLHGAGIGPERVALFGESLGSGVAVALAAERPVAALVLESPYTSIAELAQIHYWYLPAYWLVVDRFNSLDRMARVRAPVLVMHGEADSIVPVRMGRRLLEAAPPGSLGHFVPGAGHNDLPGRGGDAVAAAFLARRLGLR
ncbi:MAG: alpha/beta fold hydrolase [Alphaproteobacteria bacterium]|nr:alpha/beta fold hydrolase [Alphaproteobacteria bacterium]